MSTIMQLNCTIVPVETINKFRHLHCAGTDRFIFPGFLLRRWNDWGSCFYNYSTPTGLYEFKKPQIIMEKAPLAARGHLP